MEEKHEEFIEPEPWWRGPLKWIMAMFLLLLMVLWLIPSYSVKIDPEPNYIPTIDEVVPSDFSLNVSKSNITS